MYPMLTAYFVLFTLVSIATAAPVENSSVNPVTETLDCNNENSDVYDQRQNGTENYRIHVNGVVVLVAPAETVLQAAQLGGLQMGTETETSSPTPQPLKPKPKPPSVTEKVPNESHSPETPVVRPKDSKESLRQDSETTAHQGHK